jgi:hypothetical protein
MSRVRIIGDPFDLSTYSEHKVDDVLGLLREQFPTWPETGRLYRDSVAVENDVTPRTEEEVTALEEYDGDGLFYVVVYPGDPITAIVTVVATLALTAAILLFLTPKIPNMPDAAESSNNSLGQRVNKARPNGRIEDIFGEVISIPTLLTVPLLVFDDNLEVEHCYMAVGRGSYEISDVKDGDTPISQIAGAGVRFYGPGTSPNSGAPFYSVGAAITMPLLDVLKSNEVNGQALRSPNSNSVSGNADIRFVYPDQIQRTGSIDFTEFFEAGDELVVTSATVEGSSDSTLEALQRMRFEKPNIIRFESYNPTADFATGQTVTLTDASYIGGTTTSATVLTWTPATFPAGHSVVLDRVKMVKLVGADPTKFYRVYHAFYKDIGTRCGLWIYQSDDAADTNSVAVAAYGVASGASHAGLVTVDLAAQGGSGITGQMTVDFGDGLTAFAHYSGTYASSGLGTPTVQTGGQTSTQFVDLSGTYTISTVTATTITLSSPATVNSDWNNLDNYSNDRTEYAQASLSRQVSGSAGLDLSGTFDVVAVTAGAITLSNPAAVNANWGSPLNALPGHMTDYISPSLSTEGERWIGPFVFDMPSLDQIIANFNAPQGMYRVTKKGKNRPASVQVEMEVTALDEDGEPTGSPELFTATISGDGQDKKPKGETLYAPVSFVGPCQVRCRRLTLTDLDTEDTVIDEVQWRDAYGTAPVEAPHFGDITTVHSRTYATSGATSIKERKLNCRAVRKVLLRNEDDTFGPDLVASRNAADIICHMALDPYIGGRTLDELDVAQIYETVVDVVTYFGIPDVGEFGYTFDQEGVSFEEMVQSVAQAVFCTAYRQGSKLRLFFERATEDSILLFNHRNKLPGSETRTVRFGTLNDHDGVELDYISSVDGAKLTIYVPDDQSATKPKKFEPIGVIDRRGDGAVAFLHAMRAWNKIRYQHTTTQFTSFGEASQLILGNRIEVTDNTRPDVIDGEVRDVDGLVLEISQPFEPDDGVDYTIFLQLPDGTVETIPVTAGPDKMHCTLQEAPSLDLVTRAEAWTLTTFQIVGSDNARSSAFLVSEKGPFENPTVSVQAINYDDRYYEADGTYNV